MNLALCVRSIRVGTPERWSRNVKKRAQREFRKKWKYNTKIFLSFLLLFRKKDKNRRKWQYTRNAMLIMCYLAYTWANHRLKMLFNLNFSTKAINSGRKHRQNHWILTIWSGLTFFSSKHNAATIILTDMEMFQAYALFYAATYAPSQWPYTWTSNWRSH